MLGEILGALIWITANVTYVSYVRDGARGFKRFAAFYLGFPGTLCSLFIVPDKSRLMEPIRSESEEERMLLMEIRRDRADRISRGQGADGGEGEENT